MNTVFSNQPYILFYVNDEGKYEMLPFKNTLDFPESLKKETSYIYSKQGRGNVELTLYWFKYVPHTKKYFNVLNIEEVPNELKAMILLMGFK